MGRLYALQQERKSRTACCVEKELLKERSNGTVESESTETTADCSYNSTTIPVVRMSEDPFTAGSNHSLQHIKAFNHIDFHDDFVGGFDETVPEHCEVEFYDFDEEAEDADESLHPETDDFYPFLANDNDDDADGNAGKSLHILRDGNDASFSSFTSFASFASHDNEGAAATAVAHNHSNSSRNLLAASRNNALSRHSITTLSSLRLVKEEGNSETGGPLPNQNTGSSSRAVAAESESIGSRRTSAIRSNPRDTQPRSTRRHSAAVTLPTGSSHSSGRPEPWQQSARRLSMASASSAPLTSSHVGPSPALRETRRLITRRSGGMRPGSLTHGPTMAAASPLRSAHRLSANSLYGMTSPGVMATPKSAVTSTPRVVRRRRVSISQLKAPCLDDTEAKDITTQVELSPKPEQDKEQASMASSSKHSPRTKPSSARRFSANGRRSSASSQVSVKSTPRMPSDEQAMTETDPVADSKSVKSGHHHHHHHHTSRRSSVSSESSKKRTEEDSSEKRKQSRLHAGKREHHRHQHHHKHHHHHSTDEPTTEKGIESSSAANKREGPLADAPLPTIPILTTMETLTQEKRRTSVSLSSIREELARLKETTRRRPSHHHVTSSTDVSKKSSSNIGGGTKDSSSVVTSSPHVERQRLRRSSVNSARSQKSSATEPYDDEKKSGDDADFSNNGAVLKPVPAAFTSLATAAAANHRRSVLTTRTRTKATRSSNALHHK